MADDPTPAPAPVPAENPTQDPSPAPAPADPPADDKPNPVKELRTALDAAKAAQKAAEAKIKELEREKLSEVERLKAENEELKPIRDEHGRFASTLEELYSEELAAVPDEKRAQVEALSGVGTWADRYRALRAAKALIAAPAAPAPPAPAGTVTNPAQRKSNQALTLADIKAMSNAEINARWDEVSKILAGKAA